ncbi:hypothetical protein [Spiroplasma endosymbiont of Zeiraphera isertana]|uniref:hypothetical protein n=1 Tax=Spiroplasma endosymbiont of Zeiraphera isertana TaxID=3066313 RepID=UPI00313D221A
MSNFEVKEKKETYSFEELQETLKQQRNVVYDQAKDEFLKKELEPKLSEYETKIKEYENKINSFEEQQLFSNIKDTKKVNLIKNLMSTDNYKYLSKQEAFTKINEDYKEFLIDKTLEPIKQENKFNSNDFNPKTLLDLHTNSINPEELERKLNEKAKTTGITDVNELEKLVNLARGNALQSFNFQKNSWWNKKNHQPGLKFDFI